MNEMGDDRQHLVEGLRANSRQWREDGSEFYAVLGSHIADDVEADGPCWPVLRAHARRPHEDVPGIRLLAGVHRLVLEGRVPELHTSYPSVGGDGDAEAAWPAVRDVVEEHAEDLAAWVDHVPQTNEVGRSMALVGGWLVVAAETRLPLRLLEPGCSAGLNLRADRYWFSQAGVGFGDPSSSVRFVDRWAPGSPPFGTPCEVADRRGCDEFPIDARDAEDRLTLLAYVWPDQLERFDTLSAALEIAGATPVDVDRADAADWLAEQLADLPAGRATVVYHSYFWQYLGDDDADRCRAALQDAAARATVEAPFAHLSLEEGGGGDYARSELQLETWPGGDKRLIARCHVHPRTVDWL